MRHAATNPSAFSLQRLLPSLSFGLIAGILIAFMQVSFAALIFSGPLEDFVAQGSGLLLFGALIMSLMTALMSSAAIVVVHPQDAPSAFLGVIAATLAASMTTAPSEQVFATVVATIVLSTCVTGLCFWLLGQFRLGQLVRFIPYPVSGGFLAGTGWLLVVGGIGITTDASIGLELLQPDVLLRWVPGLLFAITLQLLLRRYSHFLLLPSLLALGIALFYLIYYLSTGSIASAGEQGWLLGPFPSGSLWQPMVGLSIFEADWGAIARSAASISTIVLVSIISLLLNTTGIEITAKRDINLNQELRAAGVANLLASLGGCPVGYQALGLSTLGHRLHVQSRLGGVFAALVLGGVLGSGANILSTFPTLIAGGFLIFIGLSFLSDWVYETWGKLPWLDYLLIWVILIVIATVGFLQGVVLGILIAALLFLVNYSRTDIVRFATTRTDYTSTTIRPPLYEQLLEQRGDRLLIVTLQGYIFFGTAHRLVQRVSARISKDDLPPLRFLILDFRLVTGVDSSAVFSLTRLKQCTDAAQVHVVLTGLHSAIQRQLGTDIFGNSGNPRWHLFPTLADGVTWCEEQMIQTFTAVGLADAPKSVIEILKEHLSDGAIDWLDYLKPGAEPAPSEAFVTFMSYLDRVDFCAGDGLIEPGTRVDGLYFLEQGTATYIEEDASQGIAESGTLAAGTVIGLSEFYTDEPASQWVAAASDGLLYHLSHCALQTLEEQQPQIAILLHRTLGIQISRRAHHAQRVANLLHRR